MRDFDACQEVIGRARAGRASRARTRRWGAVESDRASGDQPQVGVHLLDPRVTVEVDHDTSQLVWAGPGRDKATAIEGAHLLARRAGRSTSVRRPPAPLSLMRGL
jgi:hypothetical protein